jgi:hypothetical protein
MAFWFGRGRRRSKGCLGLYRRYHVCNTQVLTHSLSLSLSHLIADALCNDVTACSGALQLTIYACASCMWRLYLSIFLVLCRSCRARPAISGRRSAPPSTPGPSEDAPFAGGPSSTVRIKATLYPPHPPFLAGAVGGWKSMITK